MDANEFREKYHQLMPVAKDVLGDERTRTLIAQEAEKLKQTDQAKPYVDNLSTLLEPASTMIMAKKSENLTAALKNIVANVDIQIRVYPSLVTNAFTIPFTNMTRDKFVEALLGIPMVPQLTSLVNLLILFDTISNMTSGKIGKPFVKDKKLYIPGMNACTVYVSTAMLRILSVDELIAIILHEIGHNTQKRLYVFMRMVPFVGFLLSATLLYFNYIKTLGDEELATAAASQVASSNVKTIITTIREKMSILSKVALIGSTVLFFLFGVMIVRQMEWGADQYAKACGYGKPLQSALMRVDNYFKREITSSDNGLIRRMLGALLSVMWRVTQFLGKIKIANHPDVQSRVAALENLNVNADALVDDALSKMVQLASKIANLLHIGQQ